MNPVSLATAVRIRSAAEMAKLTTLMKQRWRICNAPFTNLIAKFSPPAETPGC
jgi:hypothetical protein